MNTLTNLVFNYASTAKIRIKKSNVYVSDNHPGVYGIVTEKLSFTVPKSFSIMGKKHLYIPKSYYERVLEQYYKNLKS